MDCGRLDQNAWVPRAVWRALERDFCLYLVTIVFALATHISREYCEKRCALDSIVSRYAAWAWEEAKMPST